MLLYRLASFYVGTIRLAQKASRVLSDASVELACMRLVLALLTYNFLITQLGGMICYVLQI